MVGKEGGAVGEEGAGRGLVAGEMAGDCGMMGRRVRCVGVSLARGALQPWRAA